MPEPMEDPKKLEHERMQEKLLSRASFQIVHEGDTFDVRCPTVGLSNVLFSNLVSQCTFIRDGKERLFPNSEVADAVSMHRSELLRKLRVAAIAHLLTKEEVEEIKKLKE